MRKQSLAILLVAVFGLCIAPLWGQVEVGRVTGTVTDQSGALVNGAKVTLTNTSTGVVTTQTTSNGVYTFVAVQPGTYTVRVEATGFSAHITDNIVVNVQKTDTVDAQLNPGSVNEQVTVNTSTPLLQTETADVGQTISSIVVNDMPLNGRQWSSLGMLAAGVTSVSPGASGAGWGAPGGPSDKVYSINGQPDGNNDFRLNGVSDMTGFFDPGAGFQPPPDAIQEFKIQNSDYSAEFGRGTAGVINAVVKSGTNQLHGDLWDYWRNDALDAQSYFSAQQHLPLPELRQNQYGGTIGGPVYIPHIYNGHNKTFFFFDFQQLRAINGGGLYQTIVPTSLMHSSGFTNLNELITYATGTNTDALGRVFPTGTILDPATTRAIAAGGTDSITGLTNASSGTVYVRDPFYSGSLAGVTDFTTPAIKSQLNMLPAGRLDPNALKLLTLFPSPTNTDSYYSGNFFKNVKSHMDDPQLDVRIDHNFNERNMISGFFSWSNQQTDTETALPPVIANQGGKTILTENWAGNGTYTHLFSNSLSNEVRIGYLKEYAFGGPAVANELGIPAQYGIAGAPQFAGNGGLPTISIGGLSSLGPGGWASTVQTEHTIQIIDNLTKIYGQHVLKTGAEINIFKSNIFQPVWGRGYEGFSGAYTDIPNLNNGTTGIAQFLLAPGASSVGDTSFVGGPDAVDYSNSDFTHAHRYYIGAYFEDAWKVTPTLTINLGLRYDLFTPYGEDNGRQANFIPDHGGAGPGGAYYIPQQTCGTSMSPEFEPLLNQDGIRLVCSPGLDTGSARKTNFAPRVGIAKRITPKWVVRAGSGINYSQLDTIGYGPVISQNYPFLWTVGYNAQNSVTPLRFPNPQTGTLATLETGISPINPASLDPHGLTLQGRYPYNQPTPYTLGWNLTNQYELTRNDSIQVAYVGNVSRHLTSLLGVNGPTQLLLPGTSLVAQSPGAPNFIPFPDFGGGTMHTTTGTGAYNSVQLNYQHRFSSGLQVLANYTFAHCLSDNDPLDGGPGARAQFLPGFGQRAEYTNCMESVRHTVHFSGVYKLPYGIGMHWQGNRITNAILGNWQVNWIYMRQTGNFFGVGCPLATTSGMGCNAVITGDPYAGARTLDHWLNGAAFTNPTPPTAADATPTGVLFNQQDFALLGGRNLNLQGPSWYNIDASVFKDFHLSESTYFQFRAEGFNVLNNPQFNFPGDLNFLTDPNFAKISSVRNGGRVMQLALKFYF
jgi:hypothetical protein